MELYTCSNTINTKSITSKLRLWRKRIFKRKNKKNKKKTRKSLAKIKRTRKEIRRLEKRGKIWYEKFWRIKKKTRRIIKRTF